MFFFLLIPPRCWCVRLSRHGSPRQMDLYYRIGGSLGFVPDFGHAPGALSEWLQPCWRSADKRPHLVLGFFHFQASSGTRWSYIIPNSLVDLYWPSRSVENEAGNIGSRLLSGADAVSWIVFAWWPVRKHLSIVNPSCRKKTFARGSKQFSKYSSETTWPPSLRC